MKIDTAKSVTANLIALIQSRNPKATFTENQITLGAPYAYTDPNDADNSKIQLIAVKNKGFSGTRTVIYRRMTIDTAMTMASNWPWNLGDTSASVTARIMAGLGVLSSEFTLNGGNPLTAPTVDNRMVNVQLVANDTAKLFVPGAIKTLTLVYTLPIVNVTYATSGLNLNTLTMLGNPTAVADYRLTITGSIGSAAAANAALTVGVLPAGSIMTIINKTTLQGAGGAGGTYNAAGVAGGVAINALMNAVIDNTSGNILGGGGGGGGSLNTWAGLLGLGSGYMRSAGGGGAGTVVGAAGAGTAANGTNIVVTAQPAAGTQAAGGVGARVTNSTATGVYTQGGTGGAPGAAGNPGTSANGGNTGYTLTNQLGGAAGKAINLNGKTVTISAGNNATQIKGVVS